MSICCILGTQSYHDPTNDRTNAKLKRSSQSNRKRKSGFISSGAMMRLRPHPCASACRIFGLWSGEHTPCGCGGPTIDATPYPFHPSTPSVSLTYVALRAGPTLQWNWRFRGRLIGQVTGKCFGKRGPHHDLARAPVPGPPVRDVRGRLIQTLVDIIRPQGDGDGARASVPEHCRWVGWWVPGTCKSAVRSRPPLVFADGKNGYITRGCSFHA